MREETTATEFRKQESRWAIGSRSQASTAKEAEKNSKESLEVT